MSLQAERHILESLCRILVSDSDFEMAKQAYERVINPNYVVAIAKKHKVITILYTNLLKLHDAVKTRNGLFALCENEYFKAIRHRDVLIHEAKEAISKYNETNTNSTVVLLKGLSIQDYYPEGYVRWMRDVDIMLKSPEEAFDFHILMKNDGYTIDDLELPWFKQDSKRGLSLYGQIFLMKDVEGDFSRFDIHYNIYSVAYNAWLDYDLWSNVNQKYLDSVRVNVLNAESCLLLIFAHMLSNGYISIKDINDFVSIVLKQNVDWDRVVLYADRNQLIPQLHRMTRIISKMYTDPLIVKNCDDIFKRIHNPSYSFVWKAHDRSWKLRAFVNAVFTYNFERNHNHQSVISSVISALQCFVHFNRRLKLKFGNRNVSELFMAHLNPSYKLDDGIITSKTCILLAPLNYKFNTDDLVAAQIADKIKSLPDNELDIQTHTYSSRLFYIGKGPAEAILLNSDIYIPTVDLIIGETKVYETEKLVKLLSTIYDIPN